MMKVLAIIYTARIPIALLTILAAIDCLSAIGIIPPQSDFIKVLSSFFYQYGLLAVCVCAYLENIVGFNVYFPGSIVILTSMVLTHGKPYLALATFACIVIPSIAAHTTNFIVGRMGKKCIATVGRKEYFLTFWHPHLAAVTCYKAGKSGVSVAMFVRGFLPACLTWYVFWATTMYAWGGATGSYHGIALLLYGYLVVWTIQEVKSAFSPTTRRIADGPKDGVVRGQPRADG